ncbi:GGDEF domain-containing protein [Halothiobacillus sp. DCM-1]|uniref:GGDEF domain-containing protein n=1 Tax=Halothiobacillus sp. DCM-1 TaxID=3112558 RepID=UPI00324B289C
MINIDTVLDRLMDAVEHQTGLESLVRPLLTLFEEITGMESIYLTRIDWQSREQQVIFARNPQQQFAIPEGITVPLADTLCDRAIQEQHFLETDVAKHWPDSAPAQALGIRTYFSTPVMSPPEQIFGTLCAASPREVHPSPTSLKLLKLAGDLISGTLERERLLRQLAADSQTLGQFALTDPLTELPNRRALMRTLSRDLAKARRLGLVCLVLFVDLDGFKQINDIYGHVAGDRFLQLFAHRLMQGLRAGDFVGRFGGDEFVISTLLDAETPDAAQAEAVGLVARLSQMTRGAFDLDSVVIDYPGASIGQALVWPDAAEESAEQVISRADEAMYAVKKQRRSGR